MLTLEKKSDAALELSEWSGREEEFLAMVNSLEHNLGPKTFKDRDIPVVTADACICWAQHPTYLTGLK